ncbi:MAG: C45 family autoproteolytic acyltransferase/hydrolase [Paracoccaceae bacterium]
MSERAAPQLGWIRAQGTPRALGRSLGRAGRAAVHDVLLRAEYWKAVTDPALQDRVRAMAANVQARFPAIWEEIEGLAEGLELPLEKVFAWNCRGDLMSNVPDGCTTVQLPGPRPVIGHNEDGLPGFLGHAFVASLAPQDGPGFLSFCYPGSLPGHTFAVTGAGLVQAVNNLRLHDVDARMPRMVTGRAVLGCSTLDEVLDLLRGNKDGGGFHMTLAQAGDGRLVSVEFGGGACSEKILDRPALHANHALHLRRGTDGQSITRSSADRQAHGAQLVSDGAADPLAILRDKGGPGLPIHRTAPDDPDCENTLATAVFRVEETGVDWTIYDQNSKTSVFEGRYSRT